MYLASQIINLVGMVFGFTAFQCKKHWQIMVFKVIHEFITSIHYILLGAYTGAVMNLISCFRNSLFAVWVKKGKKTTGLIIVFSVIFIVLGALVWEGPKSIFVIVAKVLTCVAYGCKDTPTVRKLSLITNSGWFVYNVIIFYVTGFICDGCMLLSVITGIIRHDLIPAMQKKRAQKQAQTTLVSKEQE